jgi:hypothetical protein
MAVKVAQTAPPRGGQAPLPPQARPQPRQARQIAQPRFEVTFGANYGEARFRYILFDHLRQETVFKSNIKNEAIAEAAKRGLASVTAITANR